MSTLQSTNPSTGAVVGEVPIASPESVQKALDRARAAQEEWASRTIEARARVLRAIQSRMWERSEDLLKLLVAECGRPRMESQALEVGNVAGLLDYFAKRGPKILAPHRIPIGAYV